MCMLFSEKSDQLRIILGNCRIPLRLVRSLSQGPLGFQYGGRAYFQVIEQDVSWEMPYVQATVRTLHPAYTDAE